MAEITVIYYEWSGSPWAWEALFIAPKAALQAILIHIDREPHQVALRADGPETDIVSRLPDVTDDAGKLLAVPFARIVSGLTHAEAETLRTQLKAAHWTPRAADFFKEAA